MSGIPRVDGALAGCLPRLLHNDPELRELRLQNRGVTALATNHLAEALKANRWLKVLDLSGNVIGDTGAVFLAEMLALNTTLTNLELSETGLGEGGGLALVAALQRNSSIVHMGVMGNDAVPPEVSDQIHYWMDLNHHPKPLKAVLPAVEANRMDVITLDLSGDTGHLIYDEVSTQMVADALRYNTNVRRVLLDRNFRGEDKLAVIASSLYRNTTVTYLGYSGNRVGPIGARALSEMLSYNTALTEINLNDNEVGQAGGRDLLQALQTNNTCHRLWLDDNGISETLRRKLDAAQALNGQPSALKQVLPRVVGNDPTVEELNLVGEAEDPERIIEDIKRYYTNHSAIIISDALRNNTKVRTLNVANNYVGDDGCYALATMLRCNKWLTELNLNNNPITDEGLRVLVDSLQVNDSIVALHIEGVPASTRLQTELETALLVNRQPTCLKHLLPILHSNESTLTTVSFPELQDTPDTPHQYKLARLDDSSAGLLSAALRNNTCVTSLDLSRNRITDKGVARLATMLHSNRGIRSFTLAHNPLTNEAAKVLVAALKVNHVVQFIDIAGDPRVSPEWHGEIAHAVDMNTHPLTLKQVLPRLAVNDPGVRTIVLRGGEGGAGKMTDTALQHLLGVLQENVHATTVDLSGNSITNHGAEFLADFLRVNRTIVDLNVASNDIGIDGAQYLSLALQVNPTLQRFDISDNHMLDQGGAHLEAMLRQNYTLKYLNADQNNLSATLTNSITHLLTLNNLPAGVKPTLLRALDNDRTLTDVDLSAVDPRALDDATLEVTAACLEHNTYVDTVVIAGGTVTSVSCHRLALLLRTNPHLLTISLPNNSIRDDGVGCLIDSLKLNNTLVELDLTGNPITPFTLQRLRAAVLLNRQPILVKSLMLRLQNADRSLRTLSLDKFDGERYCDDTTCEVLAHYLKETATTCGVQVIDLRNNLITDTGVEALCGLLKRPNNNITALRLDGNQVGDEGLAALNRVLGGNNTLTTLSFENNDVTDTVLVQAVTTKVKDNMRRVPREVQPVASRKKTQSITVENTLQYQVDMENSILAEALADRVHIIRSR